MPFFEKFRWAHGQERPEKDSSNSALLGEDADGLSTTRPQQRHAPILLLSIANIILALGCMGLLYERFTTSRDQGRLILLDQRE